MVLVGPVEELQTAMPLATGKPAAGKGTSKLLLAATVITRIGAAVTPWVVTATVTPVVSVPRPMSVADPATAFVIVMTEPVAVETKAASASIAAAAAVAIVESESPVEIATAMPV